MFLEGAHPVCPSHALRSNHPASFRVPRYGEPHLFLGIPSDLQDAALMDGFTTFQIYWKVMLPNIRPALVSAAFIKFIYSWDACIWPLIITRDPNKEVITVAIAKLFTDQDILWELKFAGSFLVPIPVAILFIFLQRYYIQGIATTGIRE